MELLRNYQLGLMLCLAAICAMLTVFTLMTNFVSKQKRKALLIMSISSTVMLIFDRYAYTFQGNASTLGSVMVRLSNFMVFFMVLVIVSSFNMYLGALIEADYKYSPKSLEYVKAILCLGLMSLILSQKYGYYYFIDENNYYHRGSLYFLSYVFALLPLVIHFTLTAKLQKDHPKKCLLGMIFMAIPFISAIAQFFLYGLSLVNIAVVLSVVAVYMLTIREANMIYQKSNEQKIRFLEEKQASSRRMVLQTSEALASAIDAKDAYTNGHSLRVAKYSAMIADRAGMNEEECEVIYIAGLLHDVGKIGIPDSLIGKETKLTDKEFEQIKQHPIIGREILSKLDASPDICLGASYHHERFDGKGYPQGLRGAEIPEVARIIAVADAYDAMTSKRSYRNSKSQEYARNEIAKGAGTQFDPKFALIMLKIIEEDVNYHLHQVG